MNRARQAFEKFENSDSWLPVILLSLVAVVGTVVVVNVAHRLQGDTVRLTGQLFFSLGKATGSRMVFEPTGRKLEDDEQTQQIINGLGGFAGWSEGYSFLGAYDWSPGRSAETIEARDGPGSEAFYWIGNGGCNLLETVINKESVGDGAGITGATVASAQVFSIEKGTGRRLITVTSRDLPDAPWESVVSLGRRIVHVEPQDLFSAHAEHIAGQELDPIPLDDLSGLIRDSRRRKNLWLIERGGLSPQELSALFDGEDGPLAGVTSPRARTSMQLGVRCAIAEKATEYALKAYADVSQVQNVSRAVVVHNCLCPIELESQIRVQSAKLTEDSNSFYGIKAPDEYLQEMIDEATENGIELRASADALVERLESEQVASKVQKLTQPVKATIYQLKAQENE